MSAHENDAMIGRDDLGGDDKGLGNSDDFDRPDSSDDEVRGEGLGNEDTLQKVDSPDGMAELQEQRDEINERGFVSVDDEQAEVLLEEDRAGSLPNPREPEHEAERKEKLAEQDREVQEKAAEADLSPDDES